MLPVVVLPDSEVAGRDYLLPRLFARPEQIAKDAKVGTKVPTYRPFVHLRRVGGSDPTPGSDLARLDAIVHHPDDYDRMHLMRIVHALFFAAASDRAGDAVVTYRETTLGPRHMPDPADSTRLVCMCTVDLLIRSAS